jgi:hypothetical protein
VVVGVLAVAGTVAVVAGTVVVVAGALLVTGGSALTWTVGFALAEVVVVDVPAFAAGCTLADVGTGRVDVELV